MLDKPEGRIVDIEADYTCFTIPNEFVVGYGLDYDEYYRNLPYVGVLKEEGREVSPCLHGFFCWIEKTD